MRGFALSRCERVRKLRRVNHDVITPNAWMILPFVVLLATIALAPLLFALGWVKQTGDGGLRWFEDFDMGAVAAASVALLFAANVLLLGFLAELQIKVSRFFRQRVSITAREASR